VMDTASIWRALGLAGLMIWLTGLGFGLSRLYLDARAFTRLIAQARPVPAPDGFQALDLRACAQTSAPMMAGYWNPVILLPEGFVFDRAGRAVLSHEHAHILRGDAFVELAQRLIGAVFWFNPACLVLNRVIRCSREALCDEHAAQTTGDPIQMAHALLDAATRSVQMRPLMLAAQPPRKSDLRFRIRALSQASAQGVRKTPVKLMLALPLLALALALITPRVGAASLFGSTLYDAVISGDTTRVESLIAQGADVNHIYPGDGTALIAAARRGDVQMAEMLLQAGAHPNLMTRRSGAPLQVAARANSLEMVRLLVDAGAAVDRVAPRNGTALINAARGGHMQIAVYLLDAGADPNGYAYADETPLINAARGGHIDMAEMLVRSGADVSLTVQTPPHDPGGPYRSALSEAERVGQTEMVSWLQARGARHAPPV